MFVPLYLGPKLLILAEFLIPVFQLLNLILFLLIYAFSSTISIDNGGIHSKATVDYLSLLLIIFKTLFG